MTWTNDHGQQIGDVVAGWSPRAWPAAVQLAGRYVALEPLAVAHAPALYAALGGPGDHALWTYRPSAPPRDVAGMAALVAEHLAASEMESFALLPSGGVAGGAEASGIASFMRIDTATGQVEVAGVLYARSLQRTTAATEAIHLLMRYAFDDLGYRRFEWKCDSLNEPSRRAAYRLGFAYEGRFRHHLIIKGRNRDTDWFSITDAEWPAIREAHEQWLDLRNFDDSGAQRFSLSDLTAGVRRRLDPQP